MPAKVMMNLPVLSMVVIYPLLELYMVVVQLTTFGLVRAAFANNNN
jgi:hypothetical protein